MSEWIQVQEVIHTQRLELHHICASELVTLFEEPENTSIYDDKPYKNPHRVLIDDKGPLAWRVPQVKENPTVNKWFVRWIVLRVTGEIVGSTSFHAMPDSTGMIEIGLGISEAFRNQGFARETLIGMWQWALKDSEVKTLRYTVGVENAPSVHVVESFGFTYTGEQIDDEDGPESIYEMAREVFIILSGETLLRISS